MAFSLKKLGKLLVSAATFYVANKDEIDGAAKKAKKLVKGKKGASAASGPGLPPIPE